MIAVLGDMGELGADEKRLHYEVGAYAASRGLDALFCCGELSKELAKGAEEHSETMEIFYFATKEELLLHLKSYLKKGGYHFSKSISLYGVSRYCSFSSSICSITHFV